MPTYCKALASICFFWWLVNPSPPVLRFVFVPRQAFHSKAHLRGAGLLIIADVSASVRRDWFNFWLLLAAAGVSSLLTSALWRLVLRRGLVLPLRQFTAQLSAAAVPPDAVDAIAVAAQPEELHPISIAYNTLDGRLVDSWERQRSFVDGVAHELRTPITLIAKPCNAAAPSPPPCC
jgi:signal transduction histidine kinase